MNENNPFKKNALLRIFNDFASANRILNTKMRFAKSETQISPQNNNVILLFYLDNVIGYLEGLKLLKYKKSKIAFKYLVGYNAPIIQIEFIKVSRIVKIYILFDEETFFLNFITIIKTCDFEINDIMNASGFMNFLMKSNGNYFFENAEEPSQCLSFLDPCLCLSYIINVLIQKIFESITDLYSIDESIKIEKLLENEHEFFGFVRDLCPDFSIERLLQNPNIHKLSFLYTSQILPKLKIFQNFILLEVKLETNNLADRNKMKISLVYLLPKTKRPKTLEIAIVSEFESFWSEIKTIIDFFSLNVEPIIAILQNYQLPQLLRYVKFPKSIQDFNQMFYFEKTNIQDVICQFFSLERHQFRSSWKCFNKKNQLIQYHFRQNVMVASADIFSIMIALFRENYKFILLSFWFTLDNYYHDQEFREFNKIGQFDYLGMKCFLKINIMMRRFLYFFQKIKTKKGYLKLRNDVFKEIYTSMYRNFEAKLDPYYGLRIPSHNIRVEKIVFDYYLI